MVLIFIGPNVVIGPRVRVENGVRLRHCTVLADSVIHAHSWINVCIIGRKVHFDISSYLKLNLS